LITFSNGVVELLAVYSEAENLLIATIYRQPDDTVNNRQSNNHQLKPVIEALQEAVTNLEQQTPDIIIGGDFNLPHTTWPECGPKEGCTWSEAEMITTI
jgi:exonuclease III